MSEIAWLHAHIYVYCAIGLLAGLAFLLAVACFRVSRPDTGSHVRAVRSDPVWGDDLDERDATWDTELHAIAEEINDPAASDDVRSAWNTDPRRAVTTDRPPWESAGFPAVPRTVQTVTLPPLWDDHNWHPDCGCEDCQDMTDGVRAYRQRHGLDPDDLGFAPSTDFPGPSDSPARDAGAERVPVVHAAGGDPSTDLPGPVPSVDMTMPRGNANAPAGEPRWRRFLRRTSLPVAATVPPAPQPPPCAGPGGDGEPVLEGILHASRPVAADYNADTWFADEMAKLRAWSDQGIAELEAWRHGRVLEAA